MLSNSEQPIDLLLETSDLNLAGYSVALFYPCSLAPCRPRLCFLQVWPARVSS